MRRFGTSLDASSFVSSLSLEHRQIFADSVQLLTQISFSSPHTNATSVPCYFCD
ncbi:Hypothetical protein, putative [Bodo saltans]|uniref:Uncharacterized protein n=1 Tax=Bodo saltans TaxID=75058 RepID=A0A0S4IRW8_BODSA|nr:Hypothetical protein, putative [Bodo saltans]|eukprot:CUF55164.1 Hypothetical protein, putative [Bodo saltans]